MPTVIEFSGASSTIVDIEDSKTSAGVGVEPSSSVKPTEKGIQYSTQRIMAHIVECGWSGSIACRVSLFFPSMCQMQFSRLL